MMIRSYPRVLWLPGQYLAVGANTVQAHPVNTTNNHTNNNNNNTNSLILVMTVIMVAIIHIISSIMISCDPGVQL